ncbi:hypothetical protein HMPREF1544_02730 [Mucor circinelloides 1006PhL]|uniref:Uncharacterized protein n=1 Tax=Mucor circinelloides f. circinelloides (strain 1006PhL) TaxID=1220926 RepID=S2JKA3_MUCC1|nr:hypothetical protein HMPREF1544_02730 [Mucor circinelloides 1006PhL]
MNLQEVVDTGPRGKGRPSKGGAALRAKRYYVKNHLMVLEKRKLKRYIVKVKKYIDDYKCDSSCILAKLKDLCEVHIRRHFQGLKESHLLYFINLSREDQYLAFLNVEGQLFVDSMYRDPSDIPQPDELQQLQAKVMKKHSMLLFQFCTLLSAYLLVYHVEKQVQLTTFPSAEARFEKIKSDCLALYVVRYDHIIATYKDEEYQNRVKEEGQSQEEEDEDEEKQNEEKEESQGQKEEKGQNEDKDGQNQEEEKDQNESPEETDKNETPKEVEQQNADGKRETDVTKVATEDKETRPECSLTQEPAAKKLKTDP